MSIFIPAGGASGGDDAWALDAAATVDEVRGALDIAFDLSPLGAAVINTDGEYLRVNDSLCAILGRAREEIIGVRDQLFTHPDDRAGDLELVWRILAGELDRATVEKRFVRPDGSCRWVIANLAFLRDRAGQPICWVGHFQDVTERRATEGLLRERERQLAEAQTVAQVGSWVWHVEDDTIEWSDEMCRLFGRPAGNPPAGYRDYLRTIHPDDVERSREVIEAGYAEGRPFVFDHRTILPDGSVRMLHCRGKLERGPGGEPVRLLGTVQDITEQLRVRAALEDSERLLSAGFEGASIGMAVISPDGRWLRVNRALAEMTGYTEEQLLATRFEKITDPAELDADRELVRRTLAGEIPGWGKEKRYTRGNGTTLWADVSVTLVRGEDGTPRYFVAQLEDVGERKLYEAELKRLAEQDPLTGLLNHRAFHDRLGREVFDARRHQLPISLVLLDLDHFKQVNDRHGHPVGDEVLRGTARVFEELAGEGAALARIGGEEFAWILPGVPAEGALEIAERARDMFSRHRFGYVGTLTISAGICELADARDAEQLYARADAALYWAKQHGRNRTTRYTREAAVELAAARNGL